MEQIQDTEVMAPETRMITAYISYVLNNGHKPPSVYKFAQDLGISEENFYDHFGSFTSIERKIWLDFINNTISRIENDEAYPGFGSRDKILTFYYAFFGNRYTSFIEVIVQEGKATGDIARRPFIDKRYPSVFWIHMNFLLLFWRDDNSSGFEKTDAAIEKSVNLAFELICKGAVDSVVDFAKFLYQSKVK
jgi:hypothetical protein